MRLLAEGRHAKLSLFRALLRECTYFPDPTARCFLESRVKARWRTNISLARTGERRIEKVLVDAQKALSLLRRANHGQLRPYMRIMFSAYGRIGKRRHELLGTLTKVAIDEDGQALGSSAHSDRDPEMHPNPRSASGFITKSLSNLKVHPNTAEQLPTMSSALLAVLKSHVQHKPSNLYLKSVTLKVIKLEVPPTNIWERPMPQKRVKNIVHEWYGKMLRRVLPPLPEREWRELEAKASGQLKYPILSRRLNGAVSLRYRRQAPALERALTVGRERRQLEKDHTITQRFMQRVCQAVFETTPVVMWNEERKKWSVRWGYRPLNFAPKEHTSLSQALQGIGDTVSCEKGGMNSKIT